MAWWYSIHLSAGIPGIKWQLGHAKAVFTLGSGTAQFPHLSNSAMAMWIKWWHL